MFYVFQDGTKQPQPQLFCPPISLPPTPHSPSIRIAISIAPCPIASLSREALHTTANARTPLAGPPPAALLHGVRRIVRGRLVGEGVAEGADPLCATRPLPAVLTDTLRIYVTRTPPIAVVRTRCETGRKQDQREDQKELIERSHPRSSVGMSGSVN
jgi:hypothetical protein